MKKWAGVCALLCVAILCGGVLAEETPENPFCGVYELRLVYASESSKEYAESAIGLEGEQVIITDALCEVPYVDGIDMVCYEPPIYMLWKLDDAALEAMFDGWALEDDGFRRDYDMRMIPSGRGDRGGTQAQFFKTGDTVWRMDVQLHDSQKYTATVHALYEMIPLAEDTQVQEGGEPGMSVWPSETPDWAMNMPTVASDDYRRPDGENAYGIILDFGESSILLSAIDGESGEPLARWIEITAETMSGVPLLRYGYPFSVTLDENGAALFIEPVNG